MSKHFRLASALVTAVVAFAAVPAPSVAAAPAGAAKVQQVRISSRGFGRSPSVSRYRGTRSPFTRTTSRRSPLHGFGGSILRALGIAYLFHVLFGIGAGGGSPLGLLVLVALLAYLVGRARSRPRPRRPGASW